MQRITGLTTDRKIPGSNPMVVNKQFEIQNNEITLGKKKIVIKFFLTD